MNPNIQALSHLANQLRIHCIEETAFAGSGHPSSCCSSADLVSALFFGQMRFFPESPHDPSNDRFILSKGHAAPLLYAAWAETGHVPVKDIMSLRKMDSPFEGHPTPRLDFVDIATGSLGQGLAAGVGMALESRLSRLDFMTYVLMGDGELSEGSVWEAASLAGVQNLSNLVAIADINRFGQSQETAFGHHIEIYRQRFEAFGWRTLAIDGHNMEQILSAFSAIGAGVHQGARPLAILAKTIKGKGIPEIEDKNGWHGKPLPEPMARSAVKRLSKSARSAKDLGLKVVKPKSAERSESGVFESSQPRKSLDSNARDVAGAPRYERGEKVATRKAFGAALSRLGADQRIVVLDGDVENSTFTESFGSKFPDRFFECFIAEQTMVGAASGLAALGRIPFASTFAAFFTRAYDQIRIAGGVSGLNVKLVGTHAGSGIGEDGPSQMGLEDFAMMRAVPGSIVLSPADAYATERLIERMIDHHGFCYMRTARSATPILYERDTIFEIGGARILKQGPQAQDVATVIATGSTVIEALQASEILSQESISICVVDAYSIKPLARELILECALRTKLRVVTVEDHYLWGGLGDAVAGELSEEGIKVHRLAIQEVPRSGKAPELFSRYGIDAASIAHAVRESITDVRSFKQKGVA